MEGMSDWAKSINEDPIIPLEIKRMPRRPKISKTKDPNKVKKQNPGKYSLSRKGMIMTCSLCHKEGHNKKCCLTKGTEVIIFPNFIF
ncbi:hypothetical protein REPUB_Repub03eG0150600 [Reevesia pubescens]